MQPADEQARETGGTENGRSKRGKQHKPDPQPEKAQTTSAQAKADAEREARIASKLGNGRNTATDEADAQWTDNLAPCLYPRRRLEKRLDGT